MFRCVQCKASISINIQMNNALRCQECGYEVLKKDGFLLFDRETSSWYYDGNENDSVFLEQEDASTALRFRRYFYPLLQKWKVSKDTKILCLGCGGGADVEELHQLGFGETYGVDMGWRYKWWKEKNRSPKYYFVIDGKELPFIDGYFDIIISLGVIEHVGAKGASAELYSDYRQRRLQFMSESLRILKNNGRLILACPNRSFPIDFQHNISFNKIAKYLAKKTGFSIHSSRNRFLLNYKDVAEYLHSLPYNTDMIPLTVNNYLGLSFTKSRFLRPLAIIFKLYLYILDKFPIQLRASFINPYMISEIRKCG